MRNIIDISAEKLLNRLNTIGISLHANGDMIDCYGSKAKLNQPIIEIIRNNKVALLKLIRLPSIIHQFINQLIKGECMKVLKEIPDDSIDSVVTDPPYGLGFMGKKWDKENPSVEIWKEVLRVLKPGAFICVMSSIRPDLFSRTAMNIEAAGFVTHFDPIIWTYATGFPKAHNIGKAIDKKMGAVREVIGEKIYPDMKGGKYGNSENAKTTVQYTKPTTSEAKLYERAYAGCHLKPAAEVIIRAMKPLTEKTYTNQALSNGKGVSWMDDCRIPYAEQEVQYTEGQDEIKGRFPSTLLVADDVLEDGITRRGGSFPAKRGKSEFFGLDQKKSQRTGTIKDKGGYSRYFSIDAWAEHNLPEQVVRNLPFLIVPKPKKAEKEAGLEDMETKRIEGRDPGQDEKNNAFKVRPSGRKNTHPTVKPLKLMAYLITMSSRTGDVILDPFCGSGTTCIAAHMLDRRFIGIEQEAEYHEIAMKRLKYWDEMVKKQG